MCQSLSCRASSSWSCCCLDTRTSGRSWTWRWPPPRQGWTGNRNRRHHICSHLRRHPSGAGRSESPGSCCYGRPPVDATTLNISTKNSNFLISISWSKKSNSVKNSPSQPQSSLPGWQRWHIDASCSSGSPDRWARVTRLPITFVWGKSSFRKSMYICVMHDLKYLKKANPLSRIVRHITWYVVMHPSVNFTPDIAMVKMGWFAGL